MIDYQKIATAEKHYSCYGYTKMEVPWWVSSSIMDITRPPHAKDRRDFFLAPVEKFLVASAEQSFLSLAEEGKLPAGKFFATTPCFRDEVEDELHQKYFVKTELIDTRSTNPDFSMLRTMIDDALFFFEKQVPERNNLEVVATSEGFDILYKDIELGSYGIRSCPFLTWVYGTGCAEPRLSLVNKIP